MEQNKSKEEDNYDNEFIKDEIEDVPLTPKNEKNKLDNNEIEIGYNPYIKKRAKNNKSISKVLEKSNIKVNKPIIQKIFENESEHIFYDEKIKIKKIDFMYDDDIKIERIVIRNTDTESIELYMPYIIYSNDNVFNYINVKWYLIKKNGDIYCINDDKDRKWKKIINKYLVDNKDEIFNSEKKYLYDKNSLRIIKLNHDDEGIYYFNIYANDYFLKSSPKINLKIHNRWFQNKTRKSCIKFIIFILFIIMVISGIRYWMFSLYKSDYEANKNYYQCLIDAKGNSTLSADCNKERKQFGGANWIDPNLISIPFFIWGLITFGWLSD